MDALKEPQQLQINEDDVALSTRLATTRWPWNAFRGWRELDSAFLLDLRVGTLVLLPKRAIPDQAATEELRSILRTRIVIPTGGFPIALTDATQGNG